MKYRESHIDKRLTKWFLNDYSHALLRGIRLTRGTMRGLRRVSVEFTYPIIAFAGKNGSGKSTVLALACCAFHNNPKGYRTPSRKNTYYTFADFFIQYREEVPPGGIFIAYDIAHDNWKETPKFPDGKGIGTQARYKKKGGKWNDYARRVARDVLFLGIDRIVPQYERSQFKSYRNVFKDTPKKGWEDKVRGIVGFILAKHYDDFRYVTHSKYRLPVVRSKGVTYSGFNMGAGESALFELFSNIYSCAEGALVVVDEIELGLHVEAQKRLVGKLKEVCIERKVQVVCTTHSQHIFECLPPPARMYIENNESNTDVWVGMSPQQAFAKMSAENSAELDILVEDDVAAAIVAAALPSELRTRAEIEVIGSKTALVKQLAALYKRNRQRNTLVLFDGDQRKKEKENIGTFMSLVESTNEGWEQWFKDRVGYLPGDQWPEHWLLGLGGAHAEALGKLFSASSHEMTLALAYGSSAEKHAEIYEVAKKTGLEERDVLTRFAMFATQVAEADLAPIVQLVRSRLTPITKVIKAEAAD